MNEMILLMLEKAFKLDEFEKEAIRDHRVAQLLSEIPNWTGAYNPDRDATLNVAEWLVSCKLPEEFAMCEDDEEKGRTRVFNISSNAGSEKKEYCEKLLLFAEMNAKRNDYRENPVVTGYNPVETGAWNEKKINELEAALYSLRGSIDEDFILSVDALLSPPEASELAGNWWELPA